MTNPLILVTGFGAYEEVEENPSARLVERLDLDPPEGIDVRTRVLPVTFRGAASGLDDALAALEPRVPDAILGLGVHKKGTTFRLEKRARTTLDPARPDMLGVLSGELQLAPGDDLTTSFDLAELASVLERGGAETVEISEDAGGFVCERLYRHALERAGGLGIGALFVHVPELEHVSLDNQLRPIRQLVGALGRMVTA